MFQKKRYVLGIVLLGISLLLNACSSASYAPSMDKTTSEIATEEVKQESMMDTSNSTTGNSTIQFDTTNKLNRKVIKTGTINLQTKTFEATVQQVMDKVTNIGGFIQTCSIEGNDLYDTYSRRYARLSVRLPNTQFDKFMNESDQFGNVTSKSIQGEDVTDQYMDTEIRLETLEIQGQRLKELLKQAGDLDKLFKIEKELANVTYEIESLKGTLKKYDSMIDYSTIDIYIDEADVYIEPVQADTFVDRIKNTFMRSVQGLIDLLQNVCLMIVGSLPFLIILIPIIIIIIKVIRIRKNKQKSDKNHKEE